MLRRVAVTIGVIAGCYNPHLQAGSPCSESMPCPSGLVCDQGACSLFDASVVDAMADADPTCMCSNANLACASGTTPCVIGCSSTPAPHCEQLAPSNGIPANVVSGTTDITINGATVFDTDTGEITGDLTRGGGTGVIDGIRYTQAGTSAAPIGVFAFDSLTVSTGAVVQLTGTRAVALIASSATIRGELDASASCGATSPGCAGPGGGTGAGYPNMAGGCGPGAVGFTNTPGNDTGGGGGAGFGGGGGGGMNISFLGGTGGTGCIAATLEPLVGGSGGGGGGPGAVAATFGGGGGGAIQITALVALTIDGTIDAGGGGGAGGAGDSVTVNAGAGGGGGGGGAILLEAPAVTITSGSIVVANGGGGGGGGDGAVSGMVGQRGQQNATPAAGGANTMGTGHGGAGAAAAIAAANATDETTTNSGGGGGGIGKIVVRTAVSPSLGGTISPSATKDMIRTQ